MKVSEKISELKSDLIQLFGESDTLIRSIELKEKYVSIAEAFEENRNSGMKYENAILEVSEVFFVSERTVKRALKFHSSLVPKDWP